MIPNSMSFFIVLLEQYSLVGILKYQSLLLGNSLLMQLKVVGS